MENLKIKVSTLLESGEVSGSIENYVCPEISDSVVKQTLNIQYSLKPIEGNILLNGSISGTLTQSCCRCLANFDFPIELAVNQVYPATLEEINLEDEIRELLILNIPVKPLCDENCKGLCPRCGKNLNKFSCECREQPEESRWESLKKLITPKNK